MSSAAYYDNYIKNQAVSGINDRIYGLYKRLLSRGLHSGSSVLEIGCGIGTLTYLLSLRVKEGKVESTDLSPASVSFAKQHIQQSNIVFYHGSILEVTPITASFEFILLFDVLEHIPAAMHPDLFRRIAGWMKVETELLINIPNPGYILYDQLHQPDVLQELDQPLYLDTLLPAFNEAGLELLVFETYNIWAKEDYQFMILRKKKEFTEELLSEKRSLLQKIRKRLSREYRKIRFPYPPKGTY